MKLNSLESIVRALNSHEVPFIVVGGLAVVAHGYGRQTHDLDIVVRLEPQSIQRAFEALETLGYQPRVPVSAAGFADPAQRQRWITEKGMTVLIFNSEQHPETPVDVFVSEPFNFTHELKHCMRQELAPGVPVQFVSLPTLLSMKRAVGRPQDLADVAELERYHGDSPRG